jgi:hypothetical protein
MESKFARLRLIVVAAAAVAGGLTAQSSQAATLLTATLTGSQEVPPAIISPNGYVNTASGSAEFVLNDPMTALTFTVTVNGSAPVPLERLSTGMLLRSQRKVAISGAIRPPATTG